MMGSDTYDFHPAQMADLTRLGQWHAAAHVRTWWDTAPQFDQRDLDDPTVARWIVAINGRPFAYMQDYAVHSEQDHPFFGLPNGSRGIDQFIGDVTMTGCGHGPSFIKQRVDAMFAKGIPVVATDPHPDNKRAIGAYIKAGFTITGMPTHAPWGRILPMTCKNPS